MRFWCLLLLSSSIAVPLFAKPSLRWNEYFQTLGSFAAGTNKNPGSCQTNGNEARFLSQTKKFPVFSTYCLSSAPNIYQLCRDAESECLNKTKSSTCINTNSDTAHVRKNSPLVKKIKEYTRRQFYEHIDNSELQNRCCQKNAECLRRFKKTSLKLVESTQAVEELAKTKMNGDVATVYISNSTIVNALSEGYINAILIHEIAHACQMAKHDHLITKVNQKLNFMFWKNLTKSDVKEYFPQSDCLLKAIDDLPNDVIQSGRASAEIFANVLFADQFPVEAFAYFCQRGVGETFGDTRAELACIVSSPEFQKKICTQASTE